MKNLTGIRREGLKPSTMLYDLGNLFLTNSEKLAWTYIADSVDGIILRMKTKDVDSYSFKRKGGVENSEVYISHGIVKPENIEIKNPDNTWVKLKP